MDFMGTVCRSVQHNFLTNLSRLQSSLSRFIRNAMSMTEARLRELATRESWNYSDLRGVTAEPRSNRGVLPNI